MSPLAGLEISAYGCQAFFDCVHQSLEFGIWPHTYVLNGQPPIGVLEAE